MCGRMAAVTVELTRGSVTWTLVPLEVRGFRVSGSIRQGELGGPWTLSVSAAISAPGEVDEADRSFRLSETETVPFNEAPDFDSVRARFEAAVLGACDRVPTPAAG